MDHHVLWPTVKPDRKRQRALQKMDQYFASRVDISFPSFDISRKDGLVPARITLGLLAEVVQAILSSGTSLLAKLCPANSNVGTFAFWTACGSVFLPDLWSEVDLIDVFQGVVPPVESDTQGLKDAWDKRIASAPHELAVEQATVNYFCAIASIFRSISYVHYVVYVRLITGFVMTNFAPNRSSNTNGDISILVREWTFRISSFAYSACLDKRVRLHRHYLEVRLDKVNAAGFLDRARPLVLYRILLAVADILWDQIKAAKSRMIIVDYNEHDAMYCVLGVELQAECRGLSQR